MFTRKGPATAGIALLAATAVSAPVFAADFLDGRVQANFLIMEGFQALSADQGAFDPQNTDPASGFQRLRFNIELTVHFNDWITGFVDIGEEPNDFAGQGFDFQLSNDLSFLDLSLLKAFNSPAAENNSIVLRLGNPVTTTFNYRGYSDGAAVQGNPLIGNSPFDIVTAESGVQVIGEHKLSGGAFNSWGWDVAVTVPTFGENFAPDRGYDLTAKARLETAVGLKLGVGYMQTDAEDQWETNAVGGIADDSSLSTTEALFGDNENYNFPGTSTSARTTHQGLIPGVDATVWMIDAQYQPKWLPDGLFRAWYGRAFDDFRFVTAGGAQTVRAVSTSIARGDSEVQGFGLEGTYYALPSKLYVAGRYTRVSNESDGVSGSPELNRIQVGVGWWLHPSTLVKAEYVQQEEELNSPGQIGSDWDGFTLEISAKF
jgi:hypothetical protein